MNKQSGFALVEGLIIVIVLALVVGGGYTMWHRQHDKNTATAKLSYSSAPVTTSAAPQVNNSSDLNTALETLNQTNVNASTTDSTQLNTQAAGF